MTETSAGSHAAPALPGLAARIIGTLFAPKDTFAAVAARPRWLGAMAVAIVVMGAAQFALLSTDVGKQLALDQQIGTIEAFGVTISDEQYAQMQRNMEFAPYTTAAGILVFAPLMSLIMAGILFAVFNAAMAGDASFKQLYSVVVHAGAISALSALFTAPMNIARGPGAGRCLRGRLAPARR